MEDKLEVGFPDSAHNDIPLQIDPLWLSFGDLFINQFFFKKGIVVVSTIDKTHEKNNGSNEFFINGREFIFSSPNTDQSPDARSLNKTNQLLSTLVNFSLKNDRYIQSGNKESSVLFNKRRREETFLPIALGSTEEKTGLYIYPWTTKNMGSDKFTGITQFVTAGCLFGGSMRGITQDNDNLELINHHIQLRPGQKIHQVSYDSTAGNPFEMTLLSEFEKTCLLIDAFTTSGQPKKLIYHLPAIDYMLFGIELFVREQMSFEALDTFVRAILLKQDEYREKIGAICQLHDIEVTFSSPFDNLFGSIDKHNPAESICAQLNIDINQNNKEKNDQTEIHVVNKCLDLLTTNTNNLSQREIWKDFISAGNNNYTDIESLFKTANAVLVASASVGYRDFETCSLLPLSEKQIQVGYDDYCKKYNRNFPERKSPYPNTLNITLFEPVVTYSPTTNGLLFYFSCCLNNLASLISEKKLTHLAAKNISASFLKMKKEYNALSTLENQTVSLDKILNESRNPFCP